MFAYLHIDIYICVCARVRVCELCENIPFLIRSVLAFTSDADF